MSALELPAAEVRRIAFHRRYPGVHIEGPPVRPRARASWCAYAGAAPESVDEDSFEGLMDTLEALERDGCTFGIQVDVAVFGGGGSS